MKQITWDWRSYFDSKTLEGGVKDEQSQLITDYKDDRKTGVVSAIVRYSFQVYIKPPVSYRDCKNMVPWDAPHASMSYEDDDYGYGGYYSGYGYGRRSKRTVYSAARSLNGYRFLCNCSMGSKHYPCRHVAALLARYERLHGPLVYTLTPEEEKEEEEERKQAELQRKREQEETQLKNHYHSVDSLMKHLPDQDDWFFHPSAMTGDFVINRYEEMKARAISQNKNEFVSHDVHFQVYLGQDVQLAGKAADQGSLKTSEDAAFETGKTGTVRTKWKKFEVTHTEEGQMLAAEISVCGQDVSFLLSADRIEKLSCTCGETRIFDPRYQFYRRKDGRDNVFCAHALLAFILLEKRIAKENPGDATDAMGDAFIKLLTGNLEDHPEKPQETLEAVRTEDLVLTPRIIRRLTSDNPELGFLIGRAGERSYVVRDMDQLVQAVEDASRYSISKKTAFDFSEEALTHDSAFWFDEMKRNKAGNDALRNAFASVYLSSFASTLATSGIPLSGSFLDRAFQHLDGSCVVYVRERGEYMIPVQKSERKFKLTLTPERNGDAVIAVKGHGHIPDLLEGEAHRYILDEDLFGMISEEDEKALEPLAQLADIDGDIDFRIGRKHLAEFYYRVIPQIQESGVIKVIDSAKSQIVDAMPVQAEFTFYMDLLEDMVSCSVRVAYDDQEVPLQTAASSAAVPETAGPKSGRDVLQERRVESLVRSYFPKYDPAKDVFLADADDSTLPWILMSGVDALSKYGEVKGSEAFRRIEVRPVPAPKVSISLDSNLLDLTIRSTEVDEDDLLDLLESYKLRKKWHRLKSGNFVSLEEDTGNLEELTSLADSLGISISDAVRGKVSIPKYRAVYVDRMLEEHNQTAASRNRPFRSLIRSFRTIEDSDYEVPDEVAGTLRSYQSYGYKWLRTLAATGFGGILADEMGLGKTLQMLACITGMIKDGERKPFLVVCPASLVYNWGEEVQKFTPSLQTVLLTGSKSDRRKMLKMAADDQEAKLYVTSYDLCKRDITMYEGITFAGIVLDEAQFAKNQNTAVAKALKTLRADTRFALTGTPIENRLSELWNIFDFLMPGFLYTAQDFRQKFELPIMKEKDKDAGERLSQMTKPFILRRRKEDVLKDLPEKLEETQAASMDEEQRHLYDAEVVRIRRILESDHSNQERFKVLAGITRLRQICCDPSLLFEDYKGASAKREACIGLIERSIDAGHRILLFSQFTSMLDILKKELDERNIRYYMITGSTPKKERVELVDNFNENDVPIFLISLRAGGTGLNLTGADVVIHYDPWWNLAVMNQATDRAHRIGQTKKVTVVKLIMADTIEEKIVELQKSKSDLADQILSGKSESLAAFSDEEILKLL